MSRATRVLLAHARGGVRVEGMSAEYMTSAYAMREYRLWLQQEQQQRRREDQRVGRAYLSSLAWTEREMRLYQERMLGIERRAEHPTERTLARRLKGGTGHFWGRGC